MKKLLVLLALSGCGQDAELARSIEATRAYMRQPEVQARLDASAEADRQRLASGGQLQPSQRELAAAQQMDRDRSAATICRERGNMAAAQPAYGGRGIAGSVNAGLQQGWAGEEVAAACWRAYQATGQMPGI